MTEPPRPFEFLAVLLPFGSIYLAAVLGPLPARAILVFPAAGLAALGTLAALRAVYQAN